MRLPSAAAITAALALAIFLVRHVDRRAGVIGGLLLLALPGWSPPAVLAFVGAATAALPERVLVRIGGLALAAAAALVLVRGLGPLGAEPFGAVVPRAIYALGPIAGLAPFAVVRARGPARIALAVGGALELGLASLAPAAAPVPGLLAGAVAALLIDLDGPAPETLLALACFVVALLLGHDRPALARPLVVLAAPSALVLVADVELLPVRRSSLLGAGAVAAALVLRARGG